MEKNRKFSWIRKVLIGLAISIMIAAGAFFWYVNDYYQATVEAVEALQSDESITVTETDDTITFTPNGKDPEEGVIFYPGGKVEAEAYAPLLRSLAEADLLVVIAKMPFHLAVFDADAAEAIMEQEVSVQDWYLAGHSLGGVMASSFAADQTDRVDGLIFLASYPSNDLTDAPFSALSIYGSEDEVLSRESYDEAQESCRMTIRKSCWMAVIMANSAITAYRRRWYGNHQCPSTATADGRGHHSIHRKQPPAIMQRIKQYVRFA
jgi:pimeloyl-ACP methyl ester carboxylesterase